MRKAVHLIQNLAAQDVFQNSAAELLPRLERLRACAASPDSCSAPESGFALPSPVAAVPAAQPQLTRRELEVLKRIAEGQSTKQLAGTLGITFKTASCHRQRLMQKLDIHDAATLVRYAIRRGLVAA
ncbi:MAG TPA: LuxR C-terminal-related transcriptional regulator [Candidatus Acidoferrales bacterium]|nr:LuxR C-terminal-related transcriptional regulator [Candidatus Acidoferrales bacterium]